MVDAGGDALAPYLRSIADKPAEELISGLRNVLRILRSKADFYDQEACILRAMTLEVHGDVPRHGENDPLQTARETVSAIGGSEAARAHASAIVRRVESLPENHELLAMVYTVNAALLRGVDQESCTDFCHRALEELQELDEPHELSIVANHCLAQLEANPWCAVSYQGAAVAAAKEVAGEDSHTVMMETTVLAQMLITAGEATGGLHFMEEAQRIRLAISAPAEDLASGALKLAMVNWREQCMEKAHTWFTEAFKHSRRSHDEVAKLGVYASFGNFLLSSGRDEEKAAALLDTAFSSAISANDTKLLLKIPLLLRNAFPAQPARWRPLFDQTFRYCDSHWHVVRGQFGDLATQFLEHYAQVC